MSNYYIDYGTGAGNFEYSGSLHDAMEMADDGVRYTQRDVEIYDADTDELVAVCNWYGVRCGKHDYDNSSGVISYGDFGHYAPWYRC